MKNMYEILGFLIRVDLLVQIAAKLVPIIVQ
jgi:hypothetical protein